MTEEKVDEFRKELCVLLDKYKLSIHASHGPMLVLKEWPHGCAYMGVMARSEADKKQKTWTISAPWGG